MDGDVKVFELTAGKVKWEVEPGKFDDAFAYNGTVPGPEIRVTEGDTVRVMLTNELPESTSIHWHGLPRPTAWTACPSSPRRRSSRARRFTYEFVAKPAGSHMYHSHHNATEQVGEGLLGAFIVEPKDKRSARRRPRVHDGAQRRAARLHAQRQELPGHPAADGQARARRS